jgi:hypothetical protein
MTKKKSARDVAFQDIRKAIKEEAFFKKFYLRKEQQIKDLCSHRNTILVNMS